MLEEIENRGDGDRERERELEDPGNEGILYHETASNWNCTGHDHVRFSNCAELPT